MTPSQYETAVAERFRTLGYVVDDRPATGDWGVDLFATKGAERLAVQAKMYGGTARPVNRAQIMELYGAAAYFDCTRSILVTDGRVRPDAETVAAKLGIEILRLATTKLVTPIAVPEAGPTFDAIWERSIIPLAGTTLRASGGRSNQIVAVDWSGLERITSNGRRQRIGIEIFRVAIERVLRTGEISRAEINDLYPGRASSGIVLILSQVPGFECVHGLVRRRS